MRWMMLLGLAACASWGGARGTHSTMASLTDRVPDFAPIPDDKLRVEVGVRGMIGGFTVGGFHAFEGGGAVSFGARHDALAIHVEGAAAALARVGASQLDGPLRDGTGARLLRLGVAARYSVFADAGGACHFCSKYAPPTELDRLDVWIEGGAGEEWMSSTMSAASRADLELGGGLEVGPRHPDHHWAIEVGLRVLIAQPTDAGHGIDHPVMLVMGGSWGT